MNWKLIVLLSMFGLAMGLITVWFIPTSIEPFFWLAIFLISAFSIGKYAPGKYFLHGFLVSIANSIWITAAHVIFFYTYIVTHPEYLEMTNQLQSPLSAHPRRMMLLTGPLAGIVSGVVLGLLSWIVGRFVRK